MSLVVPAIAARFVSLTPLRGERNRFIAKAVKVRPQPLTGCVTALSRSPGFLLVKTVKSLMFRTCVFFGSLQKNRSDALQPVAIVLDLSAFNQESGYGGAGRSARHGGVMAAVTHVCTANEGARQGVSC